MSIVFDAATTHTTNVGSTDYSLNHTTSGLNRIFIAQIHSPGGDVVGMTYAGATLTKLSTNTAGPSTNTGYYGMDFWYLTSPASGTNQFTVNWDVNPSGWHIGLMSYTGVDNNVPWGTAVTSSNVATTNITVDVTSAVGEMVIDMLNDYGAAGIPIATASQTVRHSFGENLGPFAGGGAGAEKVGAASVTMSYTSLVAAAHTMVIIAAPLKPSAPGKQRAIKYFHDINDPGGRIYNELGRVVAPWELRPNNWIKVTGLFLPSSREYANFTQNPELAYIEEVTYSLRGGLRIKTSRGELTEVLLARAAGGKTL